MNAHEVIQLDEEEIKRAEQDARDIEKEDGNRRKRWLRIGNVLAKFRAKYRADQEYGEHARASFPNFSQQVRWAAIWWATKIDAETRATCEALWPAITHPVNIRPVWIAHEKTLAEEENEIVEVDSSVTSQLVTADLIMTDPENAEIFAPISEIQPEEGSEIAAKQDQDDDLVIKPNNPLVHHKVGLKTVEILLRFTHKNHQSRIRSVFYQIASKGDKQRKWLVKFANLIQSGEIGRESLARNGIAESYQNARLVHADLPKGFADDWQFGSGNMDALNRLLRDAPKLYQIGEKIKGEESPSERVRLCRLAWNKMQEMPAAELPPAPPPPAAPGIAFSETDSGTDSVPPDQQQTIKICGKLFWPNPASPLQYKQIYAVAQVVQQLSTSVIKYSAEDPVCAIRGLVSTGRSLRIGFGSAGDECHRMLQAILDRVELFEDLAHTQWPTNSVGRPPELDA